MRKGVIHFVLYACGSRWLTLGIRRVLGATQCMHAAKTRSDKYYVVLLLERDVGELAEPLKQLYHTNSQ